MPSLHWEILNTKQKRLFSRTNIFGKENFYLAGGTALALQLGHRTSLDFDFYTPSHFDAIKLQETIENTFAQEAKITLRQKDTLFCKILNVDVSFFWYKYPLLKTLVPAKGCNLASLEDIAAMKMIAIYQRPAKRDYIDIFFLLKNFDLGKIISLVKKKYPSFNEYLALRALSFFDDLEDEKGRIKILDKDFSWEEAQKKIFEEVKSYQLGMLK